MHAGRLRCVGHRNHKLIVARFWHFCFARGQRVLRRLAFILGVLAAYFCQGKLTPYFTACPCFFYFEQKNSILYFFLFVFRGKIFQIAGREIYFDIKILWAYILPGDMENLKKSVSKTCQNFAKLCTKTRIRFAMLVKFYLPDI